MYGLITAHQPIVHLQMKTGIFKANVTLTSDKNIKVDFGSSYSKVISGVRILQSGTASCGTWVIEGSNDNSAILLHCLVILHGVMQP